MFSDRFVKFLPGGKTKKALRFFNSGNYKLSSRDLWKKPKIPNPLRW